jgi:ubiquinone biosynthesis protein
MLVMEKLVGIKITDVDTLRKKKIDPKKIARISAQSIFRQIFNYRSFHADPHPGNIIVLDQNKIAFIDFGLTGRLDETTKYILMKLLQALINKDMETLMIYLDKLIALKDDYSKQEFQIEMDEMISDYYDYSLADFDLQEIFEDVFKIMSKYKIKIPSNLFLLIKTLVTLEGIEKRLDPDFEIIKEITPFVKDFLMQEFSLATISKKIKRFAISFYDLVNILPARLDDISDKISQGRLKVKFEFTELNNLLDNLHRIINRLVYSIITASVLIGSFFIIDTKIKPRLFGYPVLSLVGLLFSFIMIVLLIIDIIRTRKH